MRALLLIMDGLGCGKLDDEGFSLAQLFATRPDLELPNLYRLGLWKLTTGDVLAARSLGTHGQWGRMRRQSPGSDGLSGRWEMAGAVSSAPMAEFAELPEAMRAALEEDLGVELLPAGISPGDALSAQLGKVHLREKKPLLFYSSTEGLLLAAHPKACPLPRLYELGRLARRNADVWRIGRVAVAQLTGKGDGLALATNRREYPMTPPRTVLNAIAEAGLSVHGIGNIVDAFARSGITKGTPAKTNEERLQAIARSWNSPEDGLIITDLTALDADGLQQLDRWFGDFQAKIEPEDFVALAGMHATDESPLMVLNGSAQGPVGVRKTYVDMASTLAYAFSLRSWPSGTAF